jgi:Tfp pilus assembly protein PilO
VKAGKLPRPAAIALIIGGDILLLALGWLLLVSPQRQNAASIARATQAADAQIQEAQKALHEAPPTVPKQPVIKTAGLYELAKAMPSTTDMPDLLLELDQVARAAGVSVNSISPGPPVPVTGTTYSNVTIQVSFSGNYYSLTDLLYRLRSLVSVQDGALAASGRLFAVDSVALSPNGIGNGLNATITVESYVYGAVAGTAGSTTPAPVTTSTDTSASTTTSTTTTAASSDVRP